MSMEEYTLSSDESGTWNLGFGLDLWKAEYRSGFFFKFFPKFLAFVVLLHVGYVVKARQSTLKNHQICQKFGKN